jgi:SAM-dependent methyltransferase
MARFPISDGLKAGLVSIWNAAHRGGWHTYDYLSAVVRGEWERCAVCGRFGPMLYRRRIIPSRLEEMWGISPALAIAFARKESCNCSHCDASLRGRRVANVLLSLYPVGSPPAPAHSLACWVEEPAIQSLRIAEINLIDGLHARLVRLPHCSSSDYRPDAVPGSITDGTRSEDLTRLTYADASFDVALTSETLEHVPDLDSALSEIRRVLVPGGRHIFTIPQLPEVRHTFARSVANRDGSVAECFPRICHPGGDVGYPVFTEFGADLPELLEHAGFECDVRFGPNRSDDVAQVYVARKGGST